MPFIVSLFKYLIIGFCFIVLVGLAFMVFVALDPTGPLRGTDAGAYAIPIVFGVAMFLVMNLGAVAILLSVHDRHKEIAEGIHRIADALETRGI